MPSGTDGSIPSSGSVNPVPNAQRWSSVSSARLWYAANSSSVNSPPSHVGDVVGDLVERRVPVDLVAGRGEERVLLVRARRGDVGGRDDPDADPLVPAGVQVAGVVQGHLRVGRVQRPDVHVVEPALAA